MPGMRSYRTPREEDADEVDDALLWVSALALFREMTTSQQARLVARLGHRLAEERDQHIEVLEFHQRTVQKALALEFVDRSL